ncbi:MAG: plasminogen-binding N-terminal domain-containing protein, partial [Campylobacterales bacterium]|nr:plasminogen-binding N-terminal domain-containing protein [Campylobacterales bacterium]
LLLFVTQIFAGIIQTPVKSVNLTNKTITIDISNVDVGMSGFIIHKISNDKEMILKNVVVSSFDATNGLATLSMSDYEDLKNQALPRGRWSVDIGDTVVLAFGYNRALLIAPNEDIYHRISKAVNVQWIHPDIFATILSLNAHPTPLKEDFSDVSSTASIGLIYFYIKEKFYTVDANSFKVLSISSAPLGDKVTNLPFYTRLGKIENNWWNFGEGTDQLEDYNSYYKALLLKYNPQLRGEL